MLDRVRPRLAADCGLLEGQPIVVGVSGGADSLCLMWVLQQTGYPVVIAHFDHQLRDDSSAEAARVLDLAKRSGLACVVGTGNVHGYANQCGRSIEEAARFLRYEFLFRVANDRAAQAVAVGHTADDQVETILMHILRGSGLSGLTGMAWRTVLPAFDPSVPVARPLLDVWHEEAVKLCKAVGLPISYDQSNDSADFLRNRVRNELVPVLRTYNPRFREGVLRMSRALAADRELLDELVSAAWEECFVTLSSRMVAFDLDRLRTHSSAMLTNLVRRATLTLDPESEPDFASLERSVEYIRASRTGHGVPLRKGIRILKLGSQLVLGAEIADWVRALVPQLDRADHVIPVEIPGRMDLRTGWVLVSELHSAAESFGTIQAAIRAAESAHDSLEAFMDYDALPPKLSLRAWRPGDSIAPLGMGGHRQKLSDLLVNRKVPRLARARWPLLCSEDSVIWIPGHRLAEPFRLTISSTQVVRLKMTPTQPPQ